MTISEIIGTLRSLIKAHSDDSLFEDSLLYSLLRSARSERLSQKLRKFQPLSPFNEQTFCVPLTREKYHDCSCVSVGCDVLKSEFELPEPLTTRTGLHMRVSSIDGRDIPMVRASERSVIKFSETLGDKLSYDVYNKKLVIWNNLTLPTVLVTMVVDDPALLAEIPQCDAQGNDTGNVCFDPMTDDFPIEPDAVNAVLERALQFALNTFNVPKDEINNAQPENE